MNTQEMINSFLACRNDSVPPVKEQMGLWMQGKATLILTVMDHISKIRF